MTMPPTLGTPPPDEITNEFRIPDGKPLLISKLSIHPLGLPIAQSASIPRNSRSFAVDKLGLNASVIGVGTLVMEFVDRVRGPRNDEFIVVPVKPTAQRLANPLIAPEKYSSPEDGLAK